MPQKRHLSWDTFEKSQRCRMKDVFFEIYLRCLKDVSRKASFLRCLWDAFEMSLSTETWLRYLGDVSCRWVTTLTFHVCFQVSMSSSPPVSSYLLYITLEILTNSYKDKKFRQEEINLWQGQRQIRILV